MVKMNKIKEKEIEMPEEGLFLTSILTMLIAVVSTIEVVVGTLYFQNVYAGGEFKKFFFNSPILIGVLTFIEINGAISLSGATVILGAKTVRAHGFSIFTIIIGIIAFIASIVFTVFCVKIFILGLT